MADRSPKRWARQHSSLTFGIVGGPFALLSARLVAARDLVTGSTFYVPSSVEVALSGGFIGGALVAWLLWQRLGGIASPLRPRSARWPRVLRCR